MKKEELEKTKEYQLFMFYKKSFSDVFYSDDYEIIKDHILLTLTVGEIRGYIQKKILKTDLKILVFSLWDNIDVYINENTVFNPFIKNNYFKQTPNETIIYELYKNIFTTCIFCVIDEKNYFNPSLCSNGIYNENISIFTDEILSQDLDEITDINLIYEKNKNLQYNINWTENILYDIKSINFYKKIINEFFYDNYFISGDELILLNNENEIKVLKENSITDIVLYDNNINDAFIKINNNEIFINDIEKYTNLIYIFPNIEKIIIKKKIYKEKYKIEFNINIKSKLEIFYENDFFIFETKKTKNIFLDRTKKINIIISKNHILFNGYNLNFELCVYLTKLIIGYQIVKKQADFVLYNKKAGTRYYSRFCQTIKKPNEVENFNPNDPNYKNINNIYFEHLYGGRDVYYDSDKQKYVSCLNNDLSNISFIQELYQGYNICLPCCYKKKKNKTIVFNKCIENNTNENGEEIILEPYIHIFKTHRIIMDQNKIGILNDKIKNLFNKNISFFFYNKKKIEKISSKKMFSEKTSLKEQKQLENILSLKKYFNFDKMKTNNIFVEQSLINENIELKQESDIDESNLNNELDYLNNEDDLNKDDNIDLNDKNNFEILENEFKHKKKINSSDFFELLKPFNQYIFVNKNKRILFAKNYIVYMANKDKKIINDLKEIYDEEDIHIYIYEEVFYFNPKILKLYYEDKTLFIEKVKFFLIIKNTIHVLKSINKTNKNENLIIKDIPFKIKKEVIEKYLDVNDLFFNKTNDKITFSNKGYYIENNKIEHSYNTKYLYSSQRIKLNKYTFGYYIVNILYKNFFVNFYFFDEEDETIFKKTFLSNIANILNINIIFDKVYIFETYKEITKDIIKILNPKFINEKELKKYI